jgi:transcription initiation factor TFIIB
MNVDTNDIMKTKASLINDLLDDFDGINSLDDNSSYHDGNHDNDSNNSAYGSNTIEKKCPECGSSDFLEDFSKGIIFCKCGQVVDNVYDTGYEKRTYEGDDHESGKYGIIHNKLLPQSSLGTMIHAQGKLKKLHIWNAMPYKERSDNVMFKRIHSICDAQNIPKKIELDAQILFKKTSYAVHKSGKNEGKTVITRGYNRSGILAACLFIACRRNGETRSTKEISSYFGICEHDVSRGQRSLLEILSDDQITGDVGTSNVLHFIGRKCDEMHIPRKYAEKAITIAKNIEKLNMISNHTTYSIAAASILLMAELCELKMITKKKISQAFHNLSDVTIGKTYNQLKNFKHTLIDDEIVNRIAIEIARQKNKKIIKKEVWDKMVEFGVDTSKYILAGSEEDKTEEIISEQFINKESINQKIMNDELMIEDSDYINNSLDNISIELSYDNFVVNDVDDIYILLDEVHTNIYELNYLTIDDEDVEYTLNEINDKLNNIGFEIDKLFQKIC